MLLRRFLNRVLLSSLFIISVGLNFVYGQTPALQLNFRHSINGKPLELDSGIYQNNLGQTYSISRFRYYISNIRLTTFEGKEQLVPGFYLIDEALPESKTISVSTIEAGTYTGLTFMLGVDSLHNCSGIQEGALDPIRGMFWAWNTGYIFLKLEGKSPSSTLTGNLIEYHVGGYRAPNNAIRTIHLNLPQSFTTGSGKTVGITIKTAINEIFTGPADIDFREIPSVTDFKNAVMMADNYSDIFSIEQ